jgi:superfamily II DNA or RNA helicase
MGTNQAFQAVIHSLGTDPRIKGTKFELVIKWWLKNDAFWSQELIPSSVKLWGESEHRTGVDIGIDLTATDRMGNAWAIQVKNWNQEISLPKSEIDKFLSSSNTKIYSKRLLITTTNSVSVNARRAIDEQEKPCVLVSLGDLEESQVWAKFSGDLESSVPRVEKKLFNHQLMAVQSVTTEFGCSDRGQLIMACGSGKTITAQRIQERLESNLTLVLLPSLLLVQQTLKSWRAEGQVPFISLSVCSDLSVNGDEPLSRVADLPFPVTTDANEIKRFLGLPGKKVVFSTYQSSPKVEDALSETDLKFDLVICDEAHRLAGKVDAAYGTVLKPGGIPSHKYLFMTATPKVFSSRVMTNAVQDDIEINSMDDEQKFGKVFHTFSFAEAIESKVLTDYKVIVMGVTDALMKELISDRKFIDFEDETLDAAALAAHFGLAKAMQKHSIKRVISFHSRVERARQFAATHSKVLAKLNKMSPPKLFAEAISGKDPAFKRRLLLDKLRDLGGFDFGVIGNAKCLTEGVDVPSLDGVAFIDPRGSQIDIVQAVGRAIRKGGPDKKVGYIILPVFFPSQDLDEQTIDESQFKPVWQVLNALKSHDVKLEEEINSIRRGLGKAQSLSKLPSKIIFDLPVNFPDEFAQKIQTYLIEKTSSIWEEWLPRLEAFAKQTGHSRPKRDSQDGEERALAVWVTHQRHLFNKGKLPRDRVQKLEKIQVWTWDPMDAQWMEYFQRLSTYAAQNNSSRVPSTFRDQDKRPLGKWVSKLRAKRDTLSQEQRSLLESLPLWTWDPFSDSWEAAFEELKELALIQGHAVTSRANTFKDGRSIGGWVIKQRKDRNLLSDRQRALLESLPGWSWNPFEDLKEVAKFELSLYVSEFGNALVPLKFKSERGVSLGMIVSRIRQDARKGNLDPALRKFVEALPGWAWHTKNDKWDSQFNLLKEFMEDRKTYPKKEEKYKGVRLGSWVAVQRRFLADGMLSEERKLRLDSLPGWSWNTKEEWKGLEELRSFLEENQGRKPNDKDRSASGFRVGSWLYQQRKNWNKLSPEQQTILSEFDWFKKDIANVSIDDKWTRNFLGTQTFINENGRLPKYKGKQVDSKLEKQFGLWLSRQTAEFDSLGERQQKQLLSLPGFASPKSVAEVWVQRLNEVAQEVKATGTIPPLRIQGKEHPNGGWIRRQKKQFERLTPEQKAHLMAHSDIWKFIVQ